MGVCMQRSSNRKRRIDQWRHKLPPEGIFVGSGVYPTDTDTLMCTMIGHYTWQCQYFSPMDMIEKILEDNQGNLAQVWGYARGFSPRLISEWLYALDEIGIDIPGPDWVNYKNLVQAEYKEVFDAHKDRFGAGWSGLSREAKKRGITPPLSTPALRRLGQEDDGGGRGSLLAMTSVSGTTWASTTPKPSFSRQESSPWEPSQIG